MLDNQLHQIFDRTYAHFWSEELCGERLDSDVAMVRTVCHLRPGMSVLDIGCAYGRIANRLASEGLMVTGLDQSPDLLELARATAPNPSPTFIQGDMRDLDLKPGFDAAVLWFSTFGYFDEQQNRAVLDGVLRCLRPGGTLAIETRNWDRIHREFDAWSVRVNGDDLLVERHEFMPTTGRQQTHQILLVGGRRYERSYFLRRYTGAELVSMLRAAGFASVSLLGEDMSPLTVDHKRMVAVAVRG
jgi:SAM-dependent methyltransferase